MKKSTKVYAGILSILPGLGQILVGRYFRGFILFFSFVILLDVALVIGPFLSSNASFDFTQNVLISVSALIWVVNIIDITRIIWWRERESIRKLKEPLLHSTFLAYMQNNLEEAEAQLRKLLRIDRDDTDALFYMGVIFFRNNKVARAKRCFEKSLQFDESKKWVYEIENILESNRA